MNSFYIFGGDYSTEGRSSWFSTARPFDKPKFFSSPNGKEPENKVRTFLGGLITRAIDGVLQSERINIFNLNRSLRIPLRVRVTRYLFISRRKVVIN